ncbi:ABC transporter permease [Paenibacillus baekrokdamisoli]|uniref:ABC transporter permease n=1 Tax=Paenibacillus baekrokdamisoli TaxID=1712516 RepID=A0A3G9J674_9BACL|nr:sugar ABC transporter permease [Paenibacillus baekrokdamisoli]MBB3072021.1 multiple sugar transport system permease protein [Paenibacillus baekrokdamisoli]BBH20323.1 ABC transporter permease [Paenibacillus baekrokdamisoli]
MTTHTLIEPELDLQTVTKPVKKTFLKREHVMAYIFVAPFMLTFLIFIVIPILAALALSFFSFNGFTLPKFIGWQNFLSIMTQDKIFFQNAIPNTIKFAILVGPGGYLLSFILAWLIHQLPKSIRDLFALALYAPSIFQGVAMTVVWTVIFSGDRVGYLNQILLNLGYIQTPVLWLQKPDHFMFIMIVISLWASMGVGFLAMLAGLQTVNQEMYEAGKIDGISNRLQEIFYITIPAIKPQMLFGAVMAVVGTLKAGAIGTLLATATGQAITPAYSGHLITNHIDDFAFIRYEFGYAAALSVILLVVIYGSSKLSFVLFGTGEDEK